MSFEGAIQNRVTGPVPFKGAGTGAALLRPRFGASADSFTPGVNPAGAASNVRFGGLKAVGNTFKYLSDKESRTILKSLIYQYGLPALLGLSLLTGPLGWAVAIVGFPISMLLSWRGEKIMEKAVEKIQASGNRKRGRPLDRIASMNKIWYDTNPQNARNLLPEYNRFLKDVLTDTNSSAKADKFRRAISINPLSKLGRHIRKAMEIKALYGQRWYGKGLKHVTGFIRNIPGMKPIALALSVAINLLFLLVNWRTLGRIVSQKGLKAAANIAGKAVKQ